MLDKLLEMLEKHAGKASRKKVPVGQLSNDLALKHKKWTKERDYLEEDIKLRIQELTTRIERQVQEEFEDRMEGVMASKKEFWESVYKELGVDPEEDYTYKPGEKTIYQYIDMDQEVDHPRWRQ